MQSPSYLAEEGRGAETAQDSRATSRAIWIRQDNYPGNILDSSSSERGATRSAVAAIMIAGLNRHAALSLVLETLVNMLIGINSRNQTAARLLWRPGNPRLETGNQQISLAKHDGR